MCEPASTALVNGMRKVCRWALVWAMAFGWPGVETSRAASAQEVPLDLARALNAAFVNVYEKVSPSVVVIHVRRPSGNATIFPPGWEFFFRTPPGMGGEPPSQGSGVILRADGYIVTNYHVITGAARDGIEVELKDGRRLPAEIVGTDSRTDLSVLRVGAQDLPAAELGDSDAVKVGQMVFALGAPMELPYTLTFGVVSAVGRSNLTRTTVYENYIQTDAAINPGNSGGPLADIEGRVIGINTLISGLHRGLGFAIPINMVKDVAGQLITKGQVERPWLGISIEGIEESEQLRAQFAEVGRGVVVRSILPGGPASRSALRAGDVILKVDAAPVRMAPDVQQAVLRRKVGDEVELEIWRQGSVQKLRIRTAQQPADPGMAARGGSQRLTLPEIFRPQPGQQEREPEDASRGEAFTEVPATLEDAGLELEELESDALVGLGIVDRNGGVRVVGVRSGSLAESAGVRAGDVILEADGQAVTSLESLRQLVSAEKFQKGLMVSLLRNGERTFAILKF